MHSFEKYYLLKKCPLGKISPWTKVYNPAVDYIKSFLFHVDGLVAQNVKKSQF